MQDGERADALGDLAGFRGEFYRCLPRRADALFELTDAVLCAEGPVSTLVGLSLAGEHRRGHGALYDGLASGRVEIDRLRRSVAGLPLPRDRDGRIVLAVDVSPWLRPDAATCPDRSFCHVYGRGKGSAQMIPGWPYSFVAALETGRTSWTTILDAWRLGPCDDATAVTAAQVREIIERLVAAGQYKPGDADILVVFDAGYDVTRLAFLLADLPVELLGRVRSDRIFRFPPPPRTAGTTGRRPKHGKEFRLADPTTQPGPDAATVTDTDRYGTARASAWNRLHPRLTHRAAWAVLAGPLPLIEGSLIRLTVDRLPGDRDPKPVWLWHSRPDVTASTVDRLWRAFLRRFDLEHTFRFLKQTLGWTRPRVRTLEQGERWTWLIVIAHTQLRLARHLTSDLRRPWEKPVTEPRRLTPARVRRGFRNLRPKTTLPASAPKPSRPGPGRPPGSKNKQRARRHDVGKNTASKHNTATTG
ncbi:NF041680 family putative transposase [Haloechinothrix alba]|uniref:NF041680 family putative transposase n=1 Tax=Haloechinothrix alba TaxID=664784 RepID=UPI001C3CD706|nr:NF041680 family putative transposase [Haloechinothrix alba]